MRFSIHPGDRRWKWPVLSGLAFLLVLAVFLLVLRDFSQDTRLRQRQALETALNRCIVSCYALEGRYPESLAYLQENYPFTYDEKRFYVDYRLLADNLMPEVTILQRGE